MTVINNLINSITNHSPKETIQIYENSIAENFEKFYKDNNFYELPLDTIIDIVKKVDFSSIEDNLPVIQNLINKSIEKFHDKACLLLAAIDFSYIQLTLNEAINILGRFTVSSLCTTISKLNKELEAEVDFDIDFALSEKDKEIETLKRKATSTNIFQASESGSLSLVKYYIHEENVDKNIKDRIGRTPLHYACTNGQMPVVQYLLETEGCDPFVLDKDGCSILDAACFGNRLDVVKYLIEGRDYRSLINHHKENCNTPMCNAVIHDCIEIVQYLISQGADPNIEGYKNQTPIEKCDIFKSYECKAFLMKLPNIKIKPKPYYRSYFYSGFY